MKAYDILMFLLLSGCATTMDFDSFMKEVERHETQTINAVYYMGTSEQYDYFRHVTMFSKSTIRISPSVVPGFAQIPYAGSDSSRWIPIKSVMQGVDSIENFVRTGVPDVLVEIYEDGQWRLEGNLHRLDH